MTNDEREALIEKAAKAILDANDVRPDDPDGDHGYYAQTWKYAVQDAEAALAVFEEAHTPTDDERERVLEILADLDYNDGGMMRWSSGRPTEQAEKVADRIVRELRRPVQDEPTDYWGEQRYADAAHAVQAEPTDAQVAAAARVIFSGYIGETSDGFDKPTYAYDREKAEHIAGRALRAALRAALQEGENQ